MTVTHHTEHTEVVHDRYAFGLFLMHLRRSSIKKIKQTQLLLHLTGWSHSSYSRLEDGSIAPQFNQLLPLYQAFLCTGVTMTSAQIQQFVSLARKRIAIQKTYKDSHTEAEWSQLLLDLLQHDVDSNGSIYPSNHISRLPSSWLPDVGHLINRPLWREEFLNILAPARHKKLIIVRGAAGIGKSSELSRLAVQLMGDSRYRVVYCSLRAREQDRTPEEALEETLATLCKDFNVVLPQQPGSFTEPIAWLLEHLRQQTQRLLVLLDHGESLLQDAYHIAPCWEQFFSVLLAAQHQAQIVLATRIWPGWTGAHPLFVEETTLPPLSQEQSVQLLQNLGLHDLPLELLQEVYQVVGGVPLCLEWLVSLVHHLEEKDWSTFEVDRMYPVDQNQRTAQKRATLQRLLSDPHILGGPLEHVVTPFLTRLLAARSLSPEARQLLDVLALAAVPLSKAALAIVCQSNPAPYDELRHASLVVASQARTQLLPLVTGAIACSLSSEQRQRSEAILIEAYQNWLSGGQMTSEREAGHVVTELALLLLKSHRLLDAAQVLLRHGWLSFHLGHMTRLARLAQEASISQAQADKEQAYGAILLRHFFAPYLGLTLDAQEKVADYRHILQAHLAKHLTLQPSIEVAVIYSLMTQAMQDCHFEDAQTYYNDCHAHLEAQARTDPDLRGSLMEKQAWLWARWSEYAEEQNEPQKAENLEQQAIDLYQQMIAVLSPKRQCPPLERSFLQKRLARALNNLAYHLNRRGRYLEALQAIEQSISLKEQGYAEIDTLADAYGEKSQILAQLGRFEQALLFDEKAYAETLRLASAGFRYSQEELPIYKVNRARLYLRIGRIEEAEQLLLEAIPIPPGRRFYAVMAQQALDEIRNIRQMQETSHYQLDWRWVDRYRRLASFDSYWWLAPAGPFTSEEEREWVALAASEEDETAKNALGNIIYQSRIREVEDALRSQQEPRLWYPALDVTLIKEHLAGLQALKTEIEQEEPNPIVRRLYAETIEEEIAFLSLIVATHEHDTTSYWSRNLELNPLPTTEEMQYTLERVQYYVKQGLLQPDEEIIAASRHVNELLAQIGLVLDLTTTPEEVGVLGHLSPLGLTQPQKKVSAQAARRFFATLFQENGYPEWTVETDSNAVAPRIEQGLRCVYIPNTPLTLLQIKLDLSHELAGHAARCIAGERSKLGLLGIHTKHSLETEEGLATYYDRQTARTQGIAHDETAIWFGTLATGLASGVLTPPQTFCALATFFEAFIYLYRLLRRPDQDAATARLWAHKLAGERAIRTFRGVPDLAQAGICYSKDALYLRGLQKIEQAVETEGEAVLDRLAVGVIALEQLPDMIELGIMATPQPLRAVAQREDLDEHILSFDL